MRGVLVVEAAPVLKLAWELNSLEAHRRPELLKRGALNPAVTALIPRRGSRGSIGGPLQIRIPVGFIEPSSRSVSFGY